MLIKVMLTNGAFFLTTGLVYFFFIGLFSSASKIDWALNNQRGQGVDPAPAEINRGDQPIAGAAAPPVPGMELANVMFTNGAFFLTEGLVYFFFIEHGSFQLFLRSGEGHSPDR
jgi:hypothetical protein